MLLIALLLAAPSDIDTDGDGLSDFHEVHKYLTDPAQADSDGDGVPDGDWSERREYSYTVRSLVHVARPVTEDVFCDDYQDARVLEEGEDYLELEVIHYPLGTAHEAITPDANWRKSAAWHAEYLRSSPSSDWNAAMREELFTALAEEGHDVDSLNDLQMVEAVSAYALKRTRGINLFTTFCSELDSEGRVRIHPDLESLVQREAKKEGYSVEDAMQHELFASGMFANRSRGSCTSSAIYLCGVLRAAGIPARIILTNPVIDASDPREVKFLERLRHPEVRDAITTGTVNLGKSWASHTYNEVWVGGRWRRLNYNRLGQPTLDAHYFGLMTHVVTTADWLEAGLARTIGLRQQLRRGTPDIFGHYNAYSCIALSDRYGKHADLAAPEEQDQVRTLAAVYTSDDPRLPDFARDRLENRALMLSPVERERWPSLKAFLARADGVFVLEGGGKRLVVEHHAGGISGGDECYVIARFIEGSIDDLVPGTSYRLRPTNRNAGYRWDVPEELTFEPPSGK